MKKKFYCPTCDWDCPYCVGEHYECVIGDPRVECETYWFFFNEALEDGDNAEDFEDTPW